MIVILFIISFLPLYSCEDWCHIIAPNQTYNGLGIYQEYKRFDRRQYWMFNKQGLKWKVNITFDESGLSMITLVESSISRLNVRISQMFGISYYRPQNEYYSVNCGVFDYSVTSCVYLYSVVNGTQNIYHNQTQPNKTNTDFVYLNPFPSQRHDSYLIAIDKNNREDRTMVGLNPREIQYMSCNTMCPSIPMVEQMDGSLFAQIDSIVDYEDKDNKHFGHILVFDINGRPFYCTQTENQSLSDEVYNYFTIILIFLSIFHSLSARQKRV